MVRGLLFRPVCLVAASSVALAQACVEPELELVAQIDLDDPRLDAPAEAELVHILLNNWLLWEGGAPAPLRRCDAWAPALPPPPSC